MILPFFNGILGFAKAPITWLLFFLNFSFFLSSSIFQFGHDQKLEALLEDRNLIKTTGSMFSQFVLESKGHFPEEVVELSKNFNPQDRNTGLRLGAYALSQKKFWSAYQEFPFRGDQVAISDWRSTMAELEKIQLVHPQFLLGVRGHVDNPDEVYRWFSYQFTHSGLLHFSGNMAYLLIFGAFLEPLLGGLGMLVIYLMSGFIAAACFLLFSPETSLPLVGASGSISGLMAVATVLMWKKPIRYFYVWFMPRKNHIGFVLLPAWLTFLVWLIPDLTGFLSSHEFSGGIAFVAHLGGEVAGILTGLALLGMQKLKKSSQIDPIKLAA